MKIVLAIIVYDRYKNIEHWLKCLKASCIKNIEVVIIVNTDCKYGIYQFGNITFIYRQNVGYDIGAFQDVCLNRLPGFPEWYRLLWVTDDVFPMATDFIKQFNNAMAPGVGIVCMEISNHVKKHIRSNAFMIDKYVTERLSFPADPVITKRQCYDFEHMSNNAFYEQVIAMGLKVIQPWCPANSPLWDSGYARKLPRQKEHEKIFGPMPVQPPFISKAEHLKRELLNDK